MHWIDDYLGPQQLDAKVSLGDFIVARNYGPPAYQLAVMVDDHEQEINHVVRGDDLVYSTYRQLAIYRALGWEPPGWLHVPLVVGPDGKRLAKRHGDSRLSYWREQGIRPEQIIGSLARSLRLTQTDAPIGIKDLLSIAQNKERWWLDIPRDPWVFDQDQTDPSA
jgi:glutamyl-tRNA synthetase